MTLFNLIKLFWQYQKSEMRAQHAAYELQRLPRQIRRDIGLPDGGFLDTARHLSGYFQHRKRFEDAVKVLVHSSASRRDDWTNKLLCCAS
jgi:hypothetical protein